MFHLAAYFGSGGAGPDFQVPGLVDPSLTRSATSSLYVFQQQLYLIAATAYSATLDRAKLSSPTLRQVNPPFIRPVYASAHPASGNILAWYADQPMRLPMLEEVGPITNNTSAANENTYVLAWLQQQFDPIPAGTIYTARATATFTATANAWTTGSFTLDQSLPTGVYAVVGTEHISATAIAHRLVFPNQIFRPGNLSHLTVNDTPDFRTITRRFGNYGNFANTAPPLLDVLCSGADASHVLYLELVPIGLNQPMPV